MVSKRLWWAMLVGCWWMGAGLMHAQAPATVPIRPDYILGPNDQILVRVPQAEELNERPFRVDAEGFLTLPIVGRLRVAGLTVQAVEIELANRLKEFIREPQVSINLVQFRSDPVFVVGAFRTPGIYPLQGRRTLVELLSSVGGLQPNANRRIRVTRRLDQGKIDLPTAVENTDRKVSTVEISLESLTQEINPAEDIVLAPYDIISAERAERIYVTGEVAKGGAIEVGERDSVSIAQVLAESGGLTPFAKRDKVRVLRPVLGTSRRAEITVDAKRIFEGRDLDFPLLANDVVFIPRSGIRAVLQPLSVSLLNSLPFLIPTILVTRTN